MLSTLILALTLGVAADARPLPIRAAAFRVTFPIVDTAGEFVTGAAALDTECSCDGGAFADCASEATEIGSTGVYYLDLSALELTCATTAARVQTSSAPTTLVVITPATATGEQWPTKPATIGTAALAQFMTVDTGETVAVAGSVAKIAQGAAGDPWLTLVPGAYGAGTAGKILGTYLDAAVSSAACANCGLIDDIYGKVSGGVSVVTAPSLSTSGALTLRVGADYYHADGRAPVFTCTSCPTLTGATVTLKLFVTSGVLTCSGVVDTPTGATKSVHVDVPAATTVQLRSRTSATYEVWVTLPGVGGHTWPEWAGALVVP